ncbi:transcriptional regulator, TetR family [Aeromicrobium marinum DSM 15272]|uniref:Transcriptional regulator, TetR family n=1 Tax=Aeromicrobium marinum DSM 15272 TaxID=585531 RepID=E2SDR4_9ACTN|nr:TetR/AcrR family transcriptional regulator [Aeromicrobium marinum]EFQ82641.1 transcriptional regulator, TetR family [Aeromicrobium marinum DSM 15272]
MTHPAKVLRAARKTGRRPAMSGTKRSLLDSATALFTDHGYAGTSLDEVVVAARVTKGALYHHFPSKLALFESVFTTLQRETVHRIEKAIDTSKDPWERARIGLQMFLEVCRDSQYRRICLQEAPVALGHERYREAERTATLGVVQNAVDGVLADIGGVDDLNEAFAAIFNGAIRSAAEFVADAEDPDVASERVEMSIGTILAGMRLLPQSAR